MKLLYCWRECSVRGNMKLGISSLSSTVVVLLVTAVGLAMLSLVEGAALAEDPQEPAEALGMESGGGEMAASEDEEKMVMAMMRRQEQEEHAVAAGVVPHHKAVQAAEHLLERFEKRMEEAEEEEGVGGGRESSNPEGEQDPRHHHHHRRPQALPQVMGRDRANGGRSIWADDAEKRASELCGTSASLECGKRILSTTEGQEMSDLSVHTKCDYRDDFLACIGTQKRDCLELASKSVLPQLPPKEVIKMEQARLWKVLWTAGGCVLTD